MSQWKRILAVGLMAGLILCAVPVSAKAVTANTVVKTVYEFEDVYNFDSNGSALVTLETASGLKVARVTMTDKGLSEPVILGGTWLLPKAQEETGPLNIVTRNDRLGAVNSAGKTVVEFHYKALWSDWLPGGAQVMWGVRDEGEDLIDAVTGKVLFTLPNEYYSASGFHGNALALVRENTVGEYGANGKYGYIDTQGNFVVQPIYNTAWGLKNGFAYVGLKRPSGTNYFALMNDQGEVVTDFIYSGLSEPAMGAGLIEFEENRIGYYHGMMNAEGEVVIPARYRIIEDFVNGVFVVHGSSNYDEAGYGMLDADGDVVLPLKYDFVGGLNYDGSGYGYDGVSDYVWVRRAAREENNNYYYGVAKLSSGGTAYANTQSILVDGRPMEFAVYALKDANGYDTNYIKLRDVAQALNGTEAQFQVGWDGMVNVTTGESYTPNGSEFSVPFSGNRSYEEASSVTRVNGKDSDLDAIVLKDDKGAGYTYYKLRDLGAALGFNVGWSAETGIYIETDKPYLGQ